MLATEEKTEVPTKAAPGGIKLQRRIVQGLEALLPGNEWGSIYRHKSEISILGV